MSWVRSLAALVIAGLVSGPLSGCAPVEDPSPVASPERQAFDTQVWPILVRDCGFPACHGTGERFFVVYGPGHTRLDPLTELRDPATPAELQLSYDRARAMIDSDDPAMSLLLRKPLDVSAGGAGHEGTDTFGRDVFASPVDPSYVVLYNWVVSQAGAPPAQSPSAPPAQQGP